MKALPHASWRLNERTTCAEIDAALAPRFATAWDAGVTSATHYHDDADAALWQAGMLLADGGDGRMRLTRAGAPVAEAQATPGARFWWDYPEGALRDTLRPLVGVRAMLPVVAHTVSRRAFVLTNGDGKIVVRALLTVSSAGGQGLHYLTLQPLRGYDAEFAEAARRIRRLADAGVDGDADAGPGLDAHQLLARHHVPAFARRTAAAAAITADMPAEQAVRTMAHGMLEQAQKHVAGVVDDIDTEFLHAYRVGLRKARSLLSLMKKTLPAAAIDKLKPRLSAMAGSTNTLRDLDVYLLAHHDYRALLPADFAPGMAELTALVRARRAAAQREVVTYFSSAAYQGDVDACLAELSLQPGFATPAAAKPVLHLVRRQMLKRYAALQAMSRLLHHGSADEDIHAVRIEFKKLRYLIEFFLDLLPKKRSLKLLADLKKIQGVLGGFNDLSVQIDFLNAFQDPRRGAMTKALNGLTAILHLKKVEVRDRIFDALDAYFTENRAIEFNLIFGAQAREEAA